MMDAPARWWEARSFVLAAILIPVLGFLGAIGIAEARRAGAPHVRVAIEGYDPRDPLRGHYLQFRLSTTLVGETSSEEAVLPLSEPFMTYGQKACLGPARDGVHVIYRFETERSPACARDLPSDFVRESHRFYVQQDRGLALEQAVRENRATVTLVLPQGASPLIDELQVDGRPWSEAIPE